MEERSSEQYEDKNHLYMDTIHKLIAKIDEQASKNTPATHKQI